jgi:prepilin-type N-terminal cleavage/methylation domain-containing protein
MKRLVHRLKRCLRQAAGERRGFTLVEVLVVLMIIAIGILPLAVVQNRARHQVSDADRFTQAATLAQRQLEWAKGRGFAAAAPDSGQEGSLVWRVNVADLDVGRLRHVEVEVSYPMGTQIETLRMASLISRR